MTDGTELANLLEMLSYAVTIVGFPLAIFVFLHQERKARQYEESETFQRLSDGYLNFLKLVLDNPDLRLLSNEATKDLSDEQRERTLAIFSILVSLFERAFLVAYEEGMAERQTRRWRSWEDYMREWCRRDDFRTTLPTLLPGEDPEFAAYLMRLVREETQGR